MLQVALESLDRADQASAEIQKHGMTSTTKTTGAIHVHPLVKVERESRALFAKLWGVMNLQYNAGMDNKGIKGWP